MRDIPEKSGRISMKTVHFITLTLLILTPAVMLFGQYTHGSVSGGGTISGSVMYDGKAPVMKVLKIEKDAKVCAVHTKYKEDLVVGSKGGLKNVVVYIDGIKSGKAWAEEFTLDQNGCSFVPHVTIVAVGQRLRILNSDGILHNIHTYSTLNPSINKAQPKFKKKISAKFAKPEFIKLRCDVHAWMSGWIVSAANPYYVVTDESGNFTILDVPAGTYTLKYWHETLGEQSIEVTVTAGGVTKSDAKFSQT